MGAVRETMLRIIKTSIVILWSMAIGLLGQSQGAEPDAYGMHVVSTAMAMPGLRTGFDWKHLLGMRDRAGIACTKLYTRTQFEHQLLAGNMEWAIRQAFSGGATFPEDGIGAVTTLLLACTLRDTSDPAARTKLTELLAFVEERSKGWSQIDVGPGDVYGVRMLDTAMAHPGLFERMAENPIQQLGDSAAIALIKIYGRDRLADPWVAKQIVPLLHEAFSRPERIYRGVDRKPSVTRLLLDCSLRDVADSDVRKLVSDLVSLIEPVRVETESQRR